MMLILGVALLTASYVFQEWANSCEMSSYPYCYGYQSTPYDFEEGFVSLKTSQIPQLGVLSVTFLFAGIAFAVLSLAALFYSAFSQRRHI